MDVEQVRWAGAVTRRRLLELGFTDRELARAVASERLQRVRKGLYVSGGAPAVDVLALRLRGVPTCVSLLAAQNVWVPPGDSRLHLLLPKSASSVRRPDVVTHWARRAGDESLTSALCRMLRCAGPEWTIASLDSALHLGLVSEPELLRLPRVLRDRADGRCESGGESLVRLRLAARRIRAEPQVVIEGVGRVDFVVGDRLVIEVDGYAFHSSPEAFERDRERDRTLVERGYLVIRLTLTQIRHDWPRVERAILAIVRSRRHRWSSGRNRNFGS